MQITDCTVREGTKVICDRAFSDKNIVSVQIPESVITIGEEAFYHCPGLESISIPEGVNVIGDYAFMNCHQLTTIHLPQSLNMIGDGVFTGCNRLLGIYIPKGFKSIYDTLLPEYKGIIHESTNFIEDQSTVNDNWWSDENGIPYIIDYLPNSSDNQGQKKRIYNDEVYSEEITDEDLSNAWVDEYGAKYSSDRMRLLKGPDLSSYHIKEGTLVICESAFSLHESLEEIVIPDSVIQIGENAFWCCKNLKTVKIPQSVKTIKRDTFRYCLSLTNVEIPASVKIIESGAFEDCPNIINLCFPKDAVVDSNVIF